MTLIELAMQDFNCVGGRFSFSPHFQNSSKDMLRRIGLELDFSTNRQINVARRDCALFNNSVGDYRRDLLVEKIQNTVVNSARRGR